MENGHLVNRFKTKGKKLNGEVNGNVRRPAQKLFTRRKQPNKIVVTLSNVRYIVECLVCMFAFFWFVALILPISVVYFTLKKMEQLVVRFIDKKAVALGGEDALWLQRSNSTDNRLIITSLIFVDRPEDDSIALKEFRHVVLERLVENKNPDGSVKFPRAKKNIRTGYFQYFYVDAKKFDIEDHVFKYDGEEPTSEEELQAIVSKLSAEPLPENRPMWYFCFVSYLELGVKKAAVIFRIHHCMADGVSLSRFLTRIFTDEYIPQNEVRKFSSVQRGLMSLKALCISPRVIISLLLSFADQSIVHGEPMSGSKKCVWSKPLDLNLVKRIKIATGTTVNDVLMACLTMALRKYLIKRGVEKPTDLTASIPVDISPFSKEIKFQNKFSVIFLKLPSSHVDALDTLFETKARIDCVKFSGEPFAMAWLMNFSVELLPEIAIEPLVSFISRKSTCVMSNVPGPQYVMSVGGNAVKYMTFWPPQRNNIGMGLSIFSYAGQVIIGAQSDIAVMSVPETLTELFDQSIAELAAKVLSG